MEFVMGWLLVLGLKECLVECATVCVKSAVILTMEPNTEEDGRKLKNIYIDLILKKIVVLVFT